MPSQQLTTSTKSQKAAASDAPASPTAHSAEALSDLKLLRGHQRHRKMATKGGEWKTKQHERLPLEYRLSWQAKSPRWDMPENFVWRTRRPHMTLGTKGGWQVNMDDAVADVVEEKETDWVGVSSGAPWPKEEVTLADLAKPARRRKQGKKADEFEMVPNSQSVIVLDDYELPEPSINEPWECIDMDEDDREVSQKLSYAEVLANAAQD